MEEKHILKTKDNIKGKAGSWPAALIINAVTAGLVFAVTDLAYETNDDFAISSKIADAYPYAGFVNYYLCRALIAVQSLFSELNVYVLFLIVISFISFAYLTKIILDACGSLPVRIMLVSFLLIFSFDHYCAIQFTKTSALVLTAGFIALTDSVIRHKGIPSYIAAFALIYTGTAVRYETLPPVLGVAAVSVAAWMLTDIKNCREEGWFRPKNLAATGLIIALTAGSFGLISLSHMKNISTPELKYADEYGLYRTNIVDYPTYEYYEDRKDEYDAIGISENDLFLIDNWYFDYDGAATMDNLRKIDGIERPEESLKARAVRSVRKSLRYVLESLQNRASNGIHIAALVILAAAMFVTLKPKRWIYVLAMGGVALGLYMALYFTGRVNYRAFYIADLSAAMWLLYYYAVCSDRDGDGYREKPAAVFAVILLAFSVLSFFQLRDNNISKYERAAGSIMPEAAEAYFAEHSGDAFVWATGEKKHARAYANPLKLPDDSDKNVFNTGSWSVLTPYITDKLAVYGMHNPIKDLTDNDHAYYVGNRFTDRLEEYYNKWYGGEGEKIRLRQVDTVGDYAVWKVETVREEE